MKRGPIALALGMALAGLAGAYMLPSSAPRAAASTPDGAGRAPLAAAVSADPIPAASKPALPVPPRPNSLGPFPPGPVPAGSVAAPVAPLKSAAGPSAAPPSLAQASFGRPLEARHAPVPVVRTARTPYVPPAEPTLDLAAVAEAKGGEEAARAAIQADGYKAVRGLGKAADGTWRARALRGATEIQVTVDAEGRVSAN